MNRILVRRGGALGDVILTTPIVRRLKHENPSSEIWVETGYPEVFHGNPYVAGVNGSGPFNRLINLDLAYEMRPKMHVVDAYSEAAFGCADAGVVGKQQWLAHSVVRFMAANKQFIAVHAAVSWPNRTIPQSTWDSVSHRLLDEGFIVVAIGTTRDMLPTGAIDLRNIPTLPELVGFLDLCGGFIGSDSALLHVAGATAVPIVGIFTSVKPEYRMPLRYAPQTSVTMPGLDCLGCLAEEPPPVTYVGCRRGDLACREVSADQIVEALLDLVGPLKSETPRCAVIGRGVSVVQGG